MLNQIEEKKAGTATSLDNGNLPMASEDSRGDDDALYLVYTAEELRWILRETGYSGTRHRKKAIQASPLDSPYATGTGVVLSMSNNPDPTTGSRVHVYNGFWDNGADPSCFVEGCINQHFRRKGHHESLWASFEGLPDGRHTYALGLGYDLDAGSIELGIYLRQFQKKCLNMEFDKRPDDPLKTIPLDSDFVFNGRPLIAVFKHKPVPYAPSLEVSVEFYVPNMFVQHAQGWFHHIQLVQID